MHVFIYNIYNVNSRTFVFTSTNIISIIICDQQRTNDLTESRDEVHLNRGAVGEQRQLLLVATQIDQLILIKYCVLYDVWLRLIHVEIIQSVAQVHYGVMQAK